AAAAAPLKILYAGETGNAAALARDLAARAQAAGLPATAEDLANYKTRELKDEATLLFIASTHGEGEPAEPALPFYEFLDGRRAPPLPQLRFAVLALGDSTYEFFCEAGKRLDRRLEELGAQRLCERVDCDVEYEADAGRWFDALLARLQADGGASAGAAANGASVAVAAALAPALQPYGKQRPFPAQVSANIRLTGRGSTKDTRHIELELEGAGLDYVPGDALGVLPQNDPALAAELLELFGWSGSEAVTGRNGDTTIAAALQTEFEISALTPRFIEQWATLSGAAQLAERVAQMPRSELAAFMRENHITDLVRAYPAPGIAPAALLPALRGLQPRLYSIASSAELAPGEVHLCVAPLRYQLQQRERHGVASLHLAERLGVGDSVPVYVQQNEHFRLPADAATPIVMIGAGTGVAPYRAFLQQREARGERGRSWLFFGERNFRTDFLYQAEWQGWLRAGLLTRADVAFSRDQHEKIYVQHRLLQQGDELYRWIADGAHLYVCGDANGMAQDVNAALLSVIAAGRERGDEDAADYLRELQVAGRYQKDVY
ncbi:MAG: assimilatory sulfite reductase (NADPH) flavoprotein subunit, partial [Burkholderiaceae bacterium]